MMKLCVNDENICMTELLMYHGISMETYIVLNLPCDL